MQTFHIRSLLPRYKIPVPFHTRGTVTREIRFHHCRRTAAVIEACVIDANKSMAVLSGADKSQVWGSTKAPAKALSLLTWAFICEQNAGLSTAAKPRRELTEEVCSAQQ